MKFTHSLRPTSPRSTSVSQFFSLPIPDHSSSILDPRSRFSISDSDPAVAGATLLFPTVMLTVMSVWFKICFPEKEKTLGTSWTFHMEADGSHFGKGAKYDCNFWIWSVKVND